MGEDLSSSVGRTKDVEIVMGVDWPRFAEWDLVMPFLMPSTVGSGMTYDRG